MDPTEVERRYDEIEYGSRVDKAEAHEAAGRAMEPGQHGRVLFLKTAAEHWLMRGEHDRARALLAGIQDEPSEGLLATRAIQLNLALTTADPAWASALLKQLLLDFRADLVSTSTCHYVGELLRENGDLRQAHRWLTLPVTNLDPDDDLDGVEELCVEARAEVRRELGLPRDRFDALAEGLAADYRDPSTSD
ncbi:hypothetical protein [Nocardioides sp. cx-173]|uniref:hypothetical protein n=1 Tax=Nocardioides sp. cx-173 TaxID=2898796 RepID=UPI001E451C9A|nr:hypothetical protein [Nocardioides sp. cx-173]MCD4527128.1 hypothetical protein [Nocardioides sp. cx-173]UGB42491.1 hypothetical protein LQ940_02955 [Nocardioides sp. cx-173]